MRTIKGSGICDPPIVCVRITVSSAADWMFAPAVGMDIMDDPTATSGDPVTPSKGYRPHEINGHSMAVSGLKGQFLYSKSVLGDDSLARNTFSLPIAATKLLCKSCFVGKTVDACISTQSSVPMTGQFRQVCNQDSRCIWEEAISQCLQQ